MLQCSLYICFYFQLENSRMAHLASHGYHMSLHFEPGTFFSLAVNDLYRPLER